MRTKFANLYRSLGVIIYGILSIIGYAVVTFWLDNSDFCNHNTYDKDDPRIDCGTAIWAYNITFWIHFIITMAIQWYFSHVCKLYAE